MKKIDKRRMEELREEVGVSILFSVFCVIRHVSEL